MSEDTSATYRGFRNQALYALHRLLTDAGASERIYRPEAAEDLAVFDSRMQLIEVVQVKDYSSDLALSALKPKSPTGFFARLSRRRKEHPNCTTKLASFGPLGPELDGAIKNGVKEEVKHRSNVIAKLCGDNPTISTAQANAMLDELRGNVTHPSAADLMAAVMQALQGTNVAGELECSVGLLMQWVFEASEKQQDLTRQGLLLQLERIGSYLAGLRDTSAEWSVSVFPLKALSLDEDEATRLIAEYRQGIQARWEHIVAGADCGRIERLQEIHREMQRQPVVIVRGASGQGKSTLGWRYLFDFCAEGVRFHISLVNGREHAMKIANALGEHVRRLNLRAVAYLDVSPSDTGWSELIRELVASGLKVLITVREEDFRRANIAVGDFAYSEVVLDRVTKEEAERIFSALQPSRAVDALDFEHAWTRFATEEGGPLLEFTHLVSEGESLESRIASQIRRIQDEAAAQMNDLTTAHLELLALSAVANETGARVSLAQLCDSVGISPLAGALRVLENEYLIRLQDDSGGSSVAGLHALRSKAIVKALFSEMPECWEKYAVQVLPLVLDEDIESYLLAVFSRKPEFADVLLEHICTLTLRSWTHAACISNALIWEGVSQYELTNREAIRSTISKYGGGWWLVCDSFVGMGGDSHREILEGMNNALKTSIEPVSLTPKAEVFASFIAWASAASPPPAPRRPRDLTAAGDVAFWLGHTGTGGPLRIAIENLLPRTLLTELTVEELGRFVSGRARIGDATFADWHESEQQSITQKFLHDTDSVHVADDGHEVKVYFSVPIADSVTDGNPDAHDWNEQTMKRVRLLRLLFPHSRNVWGSGAWTGKLHRTDGARPDVQTHTCQVAPDGTKCSSQCDIWQLSLLSSQQAKHMEGICGRGSRISRGCVGMFSQTAPRVGKATVAVDTEKEYHHPVAGEGDRSSQQIVEASNVSAISSG